MAKRNMRVSASLADLRKIYNAGKTGKRVALEARVAGTPKRKRNPTKKKRKVAKRKPTKRKNTTTKRIRTIRAARPRKKNVKRKASNKARPKKRAVKRRAR